MRKRLVIVSGLAVIVAFVAILAAVCRYCPEEFHISFQSPMLEGERISVQKLDEAVRICPQSRRYFVFWKEVVKGEELGRRALVYERQGNLIGQEIDPGSGYSSAVYVVDDVTIHRVAQKGGTFADFAKYCR